MARRWNGRVKVVTGIRRCGKTYLLFTIFRNRLLEEGVPEDHIIAVDLESEENTPLLEPSALTSYVLERSPDADGEYYVLLDEIQMVEGFERAVSGLRSRGNLDVYVTGSNSKFLSTDVRTEFRGRGDEVRVRPLSFAEFAGAFDGTAEEAWREYLLYGGMPELLGMRTDEQKMGYLTDLVTGVYEKDISERCGERIRHPEDLPQIMRVLCSTVGSLVSTRRIQDTFESVCGHGISDKTMSAYLKVLEESFMFESAERYDVRGRRHIGALRKYYAEDVGLRNAYLGFRGDDTPHVMENILYLELRSRGYAVDVGVVEVRERSDGRSLSKQLEIDFVASLGYKQYYVQSAYATHGDGKERQETRPFRNLRDGFRRILVVGDDVHHHFNDDGVLVVNVREFLLDENAMDLRRRQHVPEGWEQGLSSPIPKRGRDPGRTPRPARCTRGDRMKFAHVSDLHLGKKLRETSLQEDQEHILAQILAVVREEKPDGVLIAGDVYDNGSPSTDAVKMLDGFLTDLVRAGAEVFMVAGNHDSERLHFGSELFERSGLYISGAFSGSLDVHTVSRGGEEVDVCLLPFVRPIQVRTLRPEEEVSSYADAVRSAISHTELTEGRRRILVTHQFVVDGGQGPEVSESESAYVGGAEAVDASLFDAFDYVALGHIHKPQSVKRETIRYCGSPLKYSRSEKDQVKSVTIVELGDAVSVRTVPLTPLREVRELRGSLDALIEAGKADEHREDLLFVSLEEDAVDAMARLREVYPNVLFVEAGGRDNWTPAGPLTAEDWRLDVPRTFAEFYRSKTGEDLTENQRRIVEELAREASE